MFAMLAGNALPAFANDPRFRSDLVTPLGQHLCSGSTDAKPLKLWAAGIFDAQIESQILTGKNGEAPKEKSLGARAKALAVLRNAGGYSFGLCTDRIRGWIAALRAPVAVDLGGLGKSLRLARSELSSQCESFQIDFADASAAKIESLPQSERELNLAPLGTGVVSLSCQPKTPKWRGPVIWYLIPIGMDHVTDAPFVDSVPLGSRPNDSEDGTYLVSWINRIREHEHLARLQPSNELNEAASRLSVDRSVDHNRTSLQGSSSLLHKQGINLLGEDRVRAEDVSTMIWLLWFSPRHRASLLRADATSIGSSITKDRGQYLGILLLGNRAPPLTGLLKAPGSL